MLGSLLMLAPVYDKGSDKDLERSPRPTGVMHPDMEVGQAL